MATLKSIGRFVEYDLSPQEELEGGLLTYNQKFLLSNDRALVAQLIMNLVYDPEHPDIFLQQDACYKGQLAVYDFLFARNEESETTMRAIIVNQPKG